MIAVASVRIVFFSFFFSFFFFLFSTERHFFYYDHRHNVSYGRCNTLFTTLSSSLCTFSLRFCINNSQPRIITATIDDDSHWSQHNVSTIFTEQSIGKDALRFFLPFSQFTGLERPREFESFESISLFLFFSFCAIKNVVAKYRCKFVWEIRRKILEKFELNETVQSRRWILRVVFARLPLSLSTFEFKKCSYRATKDYLQEPVKYLPRSCWKLPCEKWISRDKILHRRDVEVRFAETGGQKKHLPIHPSKNGRFKTFPNAARLAVATNSTSDFDRNSKQTSANFRCREGTKYRLKLLHLCYVHKTMRIKNSEVAFWYVKQKKKKNGWCVLSKGLRMFRRLTRWLPHDVSIIYKYFETSKMCKYTSIETHTSDWRNNCKVESTLPHRDIF